MTTQADGTEGQAPVEPKPVDPPTLTQEDINRAAAAARRETEAKFADYEQLKAQAAEGAELKRSQLTEMERVTKDLATEQATTARLQGSIADTMISTEVRVRAAAMGIIDPDMALLAIDRAAVVYDSADGKVKGVDEALASLVVAKPYLKGSVPTAIPNLNGGPGKAGPTPVQLTDSEKAVAARMGMTEESYALSKGNKNAPAPVKRE